MKLFPNKNERQALLFMSPFLILTSIFIISVFISGFFTSLTDAQGINPGSYIGLNNFRKIIHEPSFWQSVFVTIKLATISILIQIPVSFLLALWIESIPFKRTQGILKAAFFVPSLVNTIIAGFMFRLLFHGERCIANIILGLFQLPSKLNWINDPEMAFPLIIIITFWQCIGYQTIYFSAYHKALGKTPYEAAKIDGASKIQVLTKITIPLMKPALIFMVVTSAVSSMMLYDILMPLFPFGAPESARTIIYYIYIRSFGYGLEMGLASSAGWIAFFIILSISLFQLKFLGLGERDDD